MYFPDYIPKNLFYPEYCLKYQQSGFISAYNIIFKDGSVILRAQKKETDKEPATWISITSQLKCEKLLLPAVDIPDLLSEEEYWKKRKDNLKAAARGRRKDDKLMNNKRKERTSGDVLGSQAPPPKLPHTVAAGSDVTSDISGGNEASMEDDDL